MLLVLLACALLALAACDLEEWNFGDSGRLSQDFHYSYPLKPGGSLSVDSINGPVEISGWDQSTVDISGAKYAPTAELRDAIRIDVSAAPDSISVRAVRPSERHGNMGVHFTIKVPRKTVLDRIVTTNGTVTVQDVDGTARLRTSNGRVSARDVTGDLDIQTTNGGIELDQTGSASLRTTNGPIRAQDVRGAFEAVTTNGAVRAQVDGGGPGRPIRVETRNGAVDLTLREANLGDVSVSTSNGAITLRLPEKTNARVMASTSHSRIDSDFQVQAAAPAARDRLEGTIGAGGPTLDLSTSNGVIRLLKL